jgi:hypothetical protein
MKDFAVHYRNAPVVSSFAPKAGELIAVSGSSVLCEFQDVTLVTLGEVFWRRCVVPCQSQALVSRQEGGRAYVRVGIFSRTTLDGKLIAPLAYSDYGNQETTAFSNTRPLDARFKSLPPQAQDARLSFVKLAGPETEYAEDAIARFRSLVEVRY